MTPASTGLEFKLICKHLGTDSDLSHIPAEPLVLPKCFPPSEFIFFLHFIQMDLAMSDSDKARKPHALGLGAEGVALSAAGDARM